MKRPFKCILCKVKFKTEGDMKSHIKRVHKNKKKRKLIKKKQQRRIEKSEDESFDSHCETSDNTDNGNFAFGV